MMHGRNHELDSFVQQVASYHGWGWQFSGEDYLLEIPTNRGRTQIVHILQGADPDQMPMLFIWSPVGPAHLAQRDPLWLLRYNTELAWGACAIYGDMLVVKDTQLQSTADAEEITRMVFNVALVADNLEAEMIGGDMS